MATNEQWRQRRRLVQALAPRAPLAQSGDAKLAWAQAGKLKVGFMLPYTGTYAALGRAIENGFKLYVNEQGGKLGGRELEYFKVDDESEPAKAADNVNKLIKRDNVDVIVGTVHSGVQMAMAKVAQETDTLLIIPERRRGRGRPARCARPTSSASRSPTGSLGSRWASSRAEGVTRRWSRSPGSTRPARVGRRLQGDASRRAAARS